jgi:hypothetical protein
MLFVLLVIELACLRRVKETNKLLTYTGFQA